MHTTSGAPDSNDIAGARGALAPLSVGQAGLWALQKMSPGASAYNLPICFRVEGGLDRGAFVGACRATLLRHPVLVSRVVSVGGRPFLAPGPEPAFTELEEDAAGLDEAALVERMRRFVKLPFSLEDGPLVRLRLYEGYEGGVVVLFVVHHLVFDGASVVPFVKSLLQGYAEAAAGEGHGAAGSREELADFPRAEQEMMNSPEGEEHLRYWRERLAGDLPVLELPTDFPRPAERGFAGSTLRRELSGPAAEAVDALARESYLNPSSIFLALFKTLLHRYTGQDDLIVGVPVTTRWKAEFADRIGYFINMMAVRTRLGAAQTFAGLAEEVQLSLLDGLDHADYPFAALVSRLGVERDPRQSPVFRVGYYYQNYLRPAEFDSLQGLASGGLEMRVADLVHQEGEYELALEVYREGRGFILSLKYDPELFTARRAELMMGHLVQLAADVTADPARPLSDYRLITDEEERALSAWNETRRPYPASEPVHRLVAAQAAATPDAVALVCGERTMSYRELERESDALAAYLRSHGVGADSRVALCLERSPEMVVGMLGIMKSGAAYVPLDPEYPSARLDYMMADAEVSAVVARESTRSRLTPPPHAPVVLLEPGWGLTAAARAGAAAAVGGQAADGAGLAYVIYTSGSTGNPKGVMISHRALTNFLCSMAEEPGFAPSDRLLAVTTYCFDIAALELFLPLIRGGVCVICDGAKAKNPEQLKAEIERAAPTVMQATPATWAMLFHSGWKNERRVKILCGGEALPEPLRGRLVEGGAEVWNMFGPTETTVWSTTGRVRPDGPITIGRPIANTQVHILDARMRPAPVGVAGELCIAGDGLAEGYWKRPELTQEKFAPHPFEPGARLYRTGDLARWRDDGEIEFLGRADDQVKIRGYRIELGEVETALAAHPLVSEAAVVAKDSGGMKHLVAYYVRRAGAGAAQPAEPAVQLRAALRETLPEYMIPATFVEVAALPLTPNGKRDRKALAARELPAPRRDAPPAAALNEVESGVLRVWREVLGDERIGVEDAFFEAGGDSVSAVYVAERIGREFDCEVTVTSLFKYADVRRLSAFVAESRARRAAGREGTVGATAAPQRATDRAGRGEAELPEYYDDAVAIVGLACRFGQARDQWEFWRGLCAGTEFSRLVPPEELRRAGVPEELIRDPRLVPVQAQVAGKELFDAEFFNVMPRDAEYMDPQLRLLLLLSWHAVEDAGYAPDAIPNTGVYMSASNSFYHALLPNIAPRPAKVLSKPAEYVSWVLAQGGSIPTMISYKLGFKGPSLFVHTNCSSSLVALHLAAQSILKGESDCALVGAAALSPSHAYGYLHQPGLNFSADGHVKAFDAAADGMIGGEGGAVVVLKRARAAVRDGDNIYAVLRGTAVNNDGSDKAGFYAPSVGGQAAVIERALETAGVDPSTISYVEAHGTGTRLGDPIEVAALCEVYERHTNRRQFCGIGSVKTNLGHLDAAAGLAGCVKLALSMKHGAVPPSVNYERANPEIDFENSPFRVVERMSAWPDGGEPARAALSSFGLGGTNAHAVFERHSSARAASTAARAYVVPVSARSGERLAAYVGALLGFLEGEAAAGRRADIADIAYTMQVGRKALARRVAFVVEGLDDLAGRLREYLNAAGDGGAEVAASTFGGDDVEEAVRELAGAWAAGAEVDWLELYGEARPRRVSLPGYPFAEEFFRAPGLFGAEAEAAPARLHPLLHRNTSDLAGQRFTSEFSGREFFLADHVVLGRRTLPAVSYLEMARAAAALSIPGGAGGDLTIRDVMWSRPLVVAEETVAVHAGLTRGVNGAVLFRVYTGDAGEAGTQTIHAMGSVEASPAKTPPVLDLRALAERCGELALGADECYEAFASAGIDYGPRHRGLVSVALGRDGEGRPLALARISLPPESADDQDSYQLHPCLLDSAIQASLVMSSRDGARAMTLPFSLNSLTTYGRCPAKVWAVVRQGGAGSAGGVPSLDIDLCDESGRVYVRLEGFVSRAIGGAAAAAGAFGDAAALETAAGAARETLSFTPRWVEAPAASVNGLPEVRPRLVVFCGFEAERVAAYAGDTKYTFLPPGDEPSPALRFVGYALRLKRLLSELTQGNNEPALAQVLIPSDGDGRYLAGLAGMLKSARQESPELIAQLIEPGELGPPDELRRRLEENVAAPHDAHVRYRGGARQVVRWDERGESATSFAWREGGVYLITGGGGELAFKVAAEITRRAPSAGVVLAGRSALAGEAARRLEGLSASGARVEYVKADVTAQADVEALLAAVAERFGTLHGIIHAAGVVRDNYLPRKTDEEFRQVLLPKAEGAFLLDEMSRAFPLDFFALFASISGVFGNAGQADYAAANAFCDAFAHARQALVERGERRGLTVSIDWPLWEAGGMRLPRQIEQRLAEEKGLFAMPDAQGLAALERALGAGSPQVLVLHGDGAKLRRDVLTHHTPPQPEQAAAPAPEKIPAAPARPAFEQALSERATEYLKATVAEAIRMPAERIDSSASFEAFGIDSIMVTELTSVLEKQFGSLPKTLFFEYQSLRELAGYFVNAHAERLRALFGVAAAGDVAGDVAGDAGAEPTPVAPTAVTPTPPSPAPAPRPARARGERVDIAIIGVAGRYPAARDLEEFWQNLREGRDCITEIPGDRWDHSLFFDEDKNKPGKTYSKWGGFLSDVDKFDALFFNISPREAEYMDPQERIFMECVYEAIEDAGYTRESLAPGAEGVAGGNVGVFAGMMYEEYQLYGAQETLLGRHIALSGSPASIANRVSFFCNFQGPSVAVDTMCSSSLTAIHFACLSLHEGDCEVAVAGGVNVSIHPNKYLMLGQGKFVSSKGRCESFGLGGDGYVPGEGVGAVILKPLDRAVADGDQIYAVIKGTAVNHGGKTSGYSVPNPNAQAAVIRRAIERSGLDPATLSYLEAHGTGTVLGDPIEIAALAKCFAAYTPAKQFCAIGSVKSNVGHCESAAGVAGLTKVLLQMKHGELVPSLHSEELNPHIDFPNSPFVVQQSLAEWRRPRISAGGVEREYPRRAGISSFGAGGANAHLIVEEYVAHGAGPAPTPGPHILLLSARSETQLARAASRLLGRVRAGRYKEEELESICYTSQVGREAMEYRAAFAVGTLRQLEERLAAFADGQKHIPDFYAGRARANNELSSLFGDDEDMARTVAAWLAKGKYAKLCRYWVAGGVVEWAGLPRAGRRRRVSLPTYPFEGERFWVPVVEQQPAHAPGTTPPRTGAPFYEQLLDDLLLDHITLDEATRRAAHARRGANGAAVSAAGGNGHESRKARG